MPNLDSFTLLVESKDVITFSHFKIFICKLIITQWTNIGCLYRQKRLSEKMKSLYIHHTVLMRIRIFIKYNIAKNWNCKLGFAET